MAKRKNKRRNTDQWVEINGPKGVFKIKKSELDSFNRLENIVDKRYKQITREVEKLVDKDVYMMKDPNIVRFRMGKKRDINYFTSREAVQKQIAKRRKETGRGFFRNRSNIYKQNIISALTKVYGSVAADLINEVGKLTPEQLQYLLVQHPNDFSIDYIYYDPTDAADKLEYMTELVISVQGMNITLDV